MTVENELIGETIRPESWKVAVRSVSGANGWVVQHTPDIDKAIKLAYSCFKFGATRVEIEVLPDLPETVSTTDTETPV